MQKGVKVVSTLTEELIVEISNILKNVFLLNIHHHFERL